MKLREEIEPKIAQAEQIFPQVLNLIHEYDNACDNEDDDKCEEVARQLSELTGKEITEDDLFEHWEVDSDYQIAFGFSLAEAPILSSPLSEEELLDILRRMKVPEHETYSEIDGNAPYGNEDLWYSLNDYYFSLLKKNLKLHKKFNLANLFHSHLIDGKYIEYTPNEVLEKILNVMKK